MVLDENKTVDRLARASRMPHDIHEASGNGEAQLRLVELIVMAFS